jgi:hypothetical protein
MKKILSVLSLLLHNGFLMLAQNDKDSVSLKDIEIPNSPAFILLDKSPTSIERPTSSRAFMLNVVNSFTDGNGLPKNYAVDFTPWWFAKHPKFTSFKNFGYDPKASKQKVFGQIKKASVSFAFVNTTDSLSKAQVNNIALGLRVNLVSVRSKKDIEDYKSANAGLVKHLRLMDDKLNEAGIFYPIPIEDTDDWRKKKEEYDNKVKAFLAVEELAKIDERDKLSEIMKRKPVLALDGAVAYNNFFLNNDFSQSHFGRFGAWMTLSISKGIQKSTSSNRYFNLYAIGRFISDGTEMKDNQYVIKSFIDAGGKVELEFQRISFGYEYIYRSNEEVNTYRSSGLLKYKISDQLFLTGAFGKNFGKSDNLISMLGINWGLNTGNEKVSVVKP